MESAILIKKVLFKSFIYGFILLLISSLLYMFMPETMYNIVKAYYPISQISLMKIVIIALGMWKIILIQFFLLPAIALHCTLKGCCKKEN